MESLPNYGLANTVTGFATLFSGLLPLLLTKMIQPQPRRWVFVYWTIVVTGVFTITLHGFGETNPIFGPRWFWAFLDTGSNIVVAWAIAMGLLGDYYSQKTQAWARPTVTVLMIAGVAWHLYDRLPGTERAYLIPFGAWGGFYPGETWLIGFSWLTLGLCGGRWREIPRKAKPLLLWVAVVFFIGMLLATGSNKTIVYPFIPIHALWHLVGAYGFLIFWAFNHVRFSVLAGTTPSSE